MIRRICNEILKKTHKIVKKYAEILKDAPVIVSYDSYDWRLRNFRDSHVANLLDKDGNIVTYCYWNYVVPISKFNFEDLHSNILNALQ